MTQPIHRHILILAGGTGGHIFPGLAVASELQARQWKVSWLGSVGGMEQELVNQEDIARYLISISGVRGKGLLGWIKAPFKLFFSVTQAIKVIKKSQPDIVLGFGGFASGPGGIAAFILGKKLVLHEQNAIAGLTNRMLARVATLVIEAFPNTFGKNASVAINIKTSSKAYKFKTMGNPLRQQIKKLAQLPISKANNPVNVLVLGGSRGAQSLNREVPKILTGLIEKKAVMVKHQCGKNKLDETQHAYQ